MDAQELLARCVRLSANADNISEEIQKLKDNLNSLYDLIVSTEAEFIAAQNH